MRTQQTSSAGNAGPAVVRYRDYYFSDGDVTFKVCNLGCTPPFLIDGFVPR